MGTLVDLEQFRRDKEQSASQSPECKLKGPDMGTTIKRRGGEGADFARSLYRIGLETGDSLTVALGAHMLTATLGARRGGIAAENIKNEYRLTHPPTEKTED